MNELKFGLIGCGRIAPKHAESIVGLDEAKLIGVCDVIPDRVDEFSRKYGGLPYYDYKELLVNPDIDIVNIATPNGSHAEIGIAAARAGKHVIIEKPIGMNIKEANALINACEEAGVTLTVCHQNRFNNSIKRLRRAFEEGRFGKLTHGNATVRWNRNEDYYRQAAWRGTWAEDGGCLMTQGIHNVDLLQWFMGPVESVSAYTTTQLRDIETEDIAVAVLKFKSGALGVIEAANTIYPKNLEETLNIFGETGTVIVGGVAVNRIDVWRFGDPEEEKAILVQQEADPPNVYGFGHRELIQNVIRAIKTGFKPLVDGNEGKKALEIIMAIHKSAFSNRPVYLPVEEEFNLTEVARFAK